MDVTCAARRRPGPWAALIWLPPLLLGPITSMPDGASAVVAWLAVAAIAGLHIAAVNGAQRALPAPPARNETFVAAQGVVTAGVVAAYGSGWVPLVGLLAIAVGAAVRPQLAPYAVAALTCVSLVVVLSADGGWGDVWATFTVFLSGFTTYLFYRLYAVIAELERMRQDLARAAVEEERLRFGRDLHDLLGHTLSLVVVKAEAVRRLVDRDPAAARQHAVDIEQIGREALVQVRQAVAGYRGAGLSEELNRARDALATAGVAAEISAAPDLPPDVDAVLGWVVREGVTNVVRHAGATSCRVTLSADDDRAQAQVEDDGGPARWSPAPGGVGLVGLRERVAAAGGRLDTTAGPRGFTLSAEIPLSLQQIALTAVADPAGSALVQQQPSRPEPLPERAFAGPA